MDPFTETEKTVLPAVMTSRIRVCLYSSSREEETLDRSSAFSNGFSSRYSMISSTAERSINDSNSGSSPRARQMRMVSGAVLMLIFPLPWTVT